MGSCGGQPMKPALVQVPGPYSGTVVKVKCGGCADCEEVCSKCDEPRFTFRPCACDRCEDCDGTGSRATEFGCFGPTRWRTCPTCYGKGRKRKPGPTPERKGTT